MDVQAKLSEIRTVVAEARAMPMSTSCVVNRTDLLEQVDELAAMLPAVLSESDRVLTDRDSVIQQAHVRADDILAGAEVERARLVSDSNIVRLAKQQADTVLAGARTEADALRGETDDYVDGRLAHFEVALARVLDTVQRGRHRLRGRSGLGQPDGAGDGSDSAWPDPGR